MSRPSTVMRPAVGASSPRSTSTSVLLPAPDEPTIPTDSPRAIVRSTPRSTGSRSPAYV